MSSVLKRPVVAIAGATGHFGQYVAQAFLAPEIRNHFADVILLSRTDPAAQRSKYPQWATVNIRQYDEGSLQEVLRGVDVLVNTVGSSGRQFREQLVRAIPGTDIQVYFPSEFGADHYNFDYKHEEWDSKKQHWQLSQQLLPNVKICRVFPGLFLEDSIGPWFGFNTKEGKYEAYGSAASVVSFTSLGDTARAVARLALLPKDDVPEMVHLAGDSKSVQEIASIMEAEGAGHIEVTEVPMGPMKEKFLRPNEGDPSNILGFLMGDGKFNHSTTGYGNSNDLVNPDQGYWNWKTMMDLAKETGGRPWTS